MLCIKVDGCDPNVTGVSAYWSRLWLRRFPLLGVRTIRPFFVHCTIAAIGPVIGAYYCVLFAPPHCEKKSADSPIPNAPVRPLFRSPSSF